MDRPQKRPLQAVSRNGQAHLRDGRPQSYNRNHHMLLQISNIWFFLVLEIKHRKI